MRRLALLTAILCLALSTRADDTTRPWTFWYWMYGAVTEAGIHADLQAMKDVGLGGCYLMPIRGTAEAPANLPPLGAAPAQQLTPRFWQLVDYALAQADSLGLKMGIHICDGFALAGGPWITPEESMQKIVWSDTIVRADQLQGAILPLPPAHDGYYEDIAAFALPVAPRPLSGPSSIASHPSPATFSFASAAHSPQLTLSPTMTLTDKGAFTATEAAWVQYDFAQPRTFRNIEIAANGTNLQGQRVAVEVSDDGTTFWQVRQLVPPRQGWQNYDYNTTFTFPPATARFWRLSWTPDGTEPGSEDLDAAKWRPRLSLKNATLSALPRLDNWEGKAAYAWRIASPTDAPIPASDFLQLADIIPLTLDARGMVTTPLSTRRGAGGEAGDAETLYRILRIGHTSTGHANATAGGGKGLECDKFSAAAVDKQVDHWFGQFMRRPHAGVVKFLHVDSWECGCQNWSRNFAREFRERCGYDLLPYLPLMAGVPLVSAEKSEQVLRDVRETIGELLNDVFFTTVKRRAHDYGVQLSCESVAPTMVSDGMAHFRHADVPMGEFWLNSPTHDKPTDMLDAISGAHVYGKPIVQAEGFTEVRGVWDETPASIKPLLDRSFALGMNRLFFHVFAHNPWTDRRPGMTLDGIGLFFQRDQTWFPEARALVDYVTRCQQYLQKGRPVVDIAVYTGDEMPRRALTPDRLVTMLPGLFGPARVASEQRRLANVGCPMEESPVGVRHAAGIFDLKDWVNPLHGYHYDSMNPDGLARWLADMRDPSDLNLPRYRVLVVPQGMLVAPKTQQQIDSLRLYGITVLTEPYPHDTLPGLPPDAILPEGIAFTHRQANASHIYFLSNQTDSVRNFRAKFRLKGRVSALLDPLTDHLLAFSEEREGDYSCVNVLLQPHASVIVLSGFGFTDAWPVSQALGDARPLGKKLRWDVTFCDNGERLTTTHLFDWSQSSNDRIRYYSGRARYVTTFSMKKSELQGCTWWLRLPGLHDVAHVWLNGHDVGIAWTAPYAVELGKQLHPGKNTLEIEVVNTWHNALLGADQGKPPFEGIWTNARYRRKEPSPLPAGLTESPLLVRQGDSWLKTLFEY